ncbi:MFS general substrate transporter [Phanerochaete sordida]|uniref:MFS general substrate transporter n=1 Tax=Phanerochaete sordida TaxID=48140 RepID=A0A9P3LFE7_9APHY|nr:MFS general substrate transporter [Phanerochaete sordida]
MPKLLSALQDWRARPSAVLPLAFLQALVVGLDSLPVTYILREIRCDEYRATMAPHIPEDDVCRAPEVQAAYSTDLAVFATILAVLSVVLSGPYGRLSDTRGRKRALTVAVALNLLGDVWFTLCAFLPPLRKPVFFHLGAALQGLGGGFSVVLAGQNALIADTSAPHERSFYMGLALVMWWSGTAVGPLLSGVLVEGRLYTLAFALCVLLWALYLPYVAFVVREARDSEAEACTAAPSDAAAAATDEAPPRQSLASRLRDGLRMVLEPMIILVQHLPLLLLSISMAGTVLAVGVFGWVIPYCDVKFGLPAWEAGIVTASWSIARAVSVMFLLPVFLTAYQWLTARKKSQTQPVPAPDPNTARASETTPLLAEAAQQNSESASQLDASSLSQELTIVRVCLVLDAIGMFAIERSRNTGEVILAAIVSSFGAPAGPSMQALLTLAAPPGEVGRVLAGLSILQSAAAAVRGPIFAPLFNATIEKAPGAIWWVAAGILLLCSSVAFALNPRQFFLVHERQA